MSGEDYIRGLADEDLKAELGRRKDEAIRRNREEAERRYAARMAVRDQRRRDFCELRGIRYETFLEVAAYLEDELEESY